MKPRKRIRIKIGENEKEIIKMIGMGTIVLASLALPGLPIILKPFLKERGENWFLKLVKNLADKDVVYLGGEKVYLTQKGKEILQKIQLSEIVIPKSKQWDGLWYLVSYDIPICFNKVRDHFRELLKIYGFFQIQKSLWVYPYKCKEEIAAAANNLNMAKYIIVMETDHLPNEKNMEDYFSLN